MLLNDREIKVINLLKFHKNMRAVDLAKAMKLSEKTIRTTLNHLSITIEEYGAQINSSRGVGYELVVSDVIVFENFINQNKHKVDAIPSSPNERVNQLLHKLVLSESYINNEQIYEEWFISSKTLQQDLVKLNEVLDDYNLKIVKNQKAGFKLKGLEIDKRRLGAKLHLDYIKHGYDFDYVKMTVLEVLQEFDYLMLDYAADMLVHHLLMSMIRIDMGSNIQISLPDDIYVEIEFEIANKLLDELSKTYNIVFPLFEIEYVAAHIKGKKSTEKISDITIKNEVEEIVYKMFQVLKNTFNVDLNNDFDLRMALSLHLEPLIQRINLGVVMNNPLVHQIKERYPLAYTMAAAASSVLNKKFDFELSEDEIAYIALSIELSLERQNKTKIKKRILLVCNLGKVSVNLIKYQYLELFSEYIEDIVVTGASEIGNLETSDFDYIFTTVPINVKTKTPILEVNYFLENTDIQKIKTNFLKDQITKLPEYFREDLFLVGLKDSNKDAIISTMSKYIEERFEVNGDLEESVLNRESLASTDFSYKTALPHPSRMMSEKTIVCIGILENPILWDTREVELVVMVLIGRNDQENIQKFYQSIAKFLSDEKEVDSLIENKDFNGFITVINEIQERLEREKYIGK